MEAPSPIYELALMDAQAPNIIYITTRSYLQSQTELRGVTPYPYYAIKKSRIGGSPLLN